jgi:hypothetical protein
LRGFSLLVQEALADYLSEREADEMDLLLSLEGTLSDEEESELRSRLDQLRESWRISS